MRALRLTKLVLIFFGLNAVLGYCKCPPSKKTQKLTLIKVLQSIDTHYPQVKIARLEVIKASGALVNAKGKFDPSLQASTSSQPVGGYINNYGDTQLTIPTIHNGLKLFAAIVMEKETGQFIIKTF